MNTGRDPARAATGWGIGLAAGLVALFAVAVAGYPVGVAVLAVARHWSGAGRPGAGVGAGVDIWPLLVRTMLYAGAIGVLATAFAWPAAWALRHSGRRGVHVLALVTMPLLLPNYLAYAGWGLLRAPRTPLGDLLARQPAWATTGFNAGLAVAGLALWAWPLAAIVLGAGVRRVPDSILDTLRLEAGAWWRRWWVLGRMLAGPLGAAVGAVMLVMLGSAVPLHVAQVETYAIRVWLLLNLTPDQGAAWAAAWPLLLIAAAVAAYAAWGLGRRAASDTDASDAGHARRGGARWALVGTVALLAASIGVPCVLFLLSMREPGRAFSASAVASLSGEFWRITGPGVRSSAATGAWVALLSAGLAAAAWAAASAHGGGRRHGDHRTARAVVLVCVGLLLLAGLAPGVLIGSAVSAAWNGQGWLRWAADSRLIVVVGHLARFGFIPALLGWWLAGLESREERGVRALDGAETLRGWGVARFPLHAGAVVGVALGVGMLSFHEIEATVILQPPGVDNLAQQLLENLHYARDERLAAAVVNLLAAGLGIGYAAAYLIGRFGSGPERAASAGVVR